jgi:hypothetical protein
MTLADARGTQDQAADFSLDEPQRAQLGQALGIEIGLEAVVEVVEGLVVREAGHLQPGLIAAALELADFGFQDEVEEFAVAQLGLLGALDQLVRVRGDGGQAQLGSIALDALGDQLSHR